MTSSLQDVVVYISFNICPGSVAVYHVGLSSLRLGFKSRPGRSGDSMSGPAKSKIELKNAKVYLHLPDEATRSKILHIDIEHPIINEIIKPKEATYAAGKSGGVFIGLKKEMIERANKVLKKKMD